MSLSRSQVWKVAEPALPIAMYSAFIAADAIFKVQTGAGAALVGVGIAVVLLVGGLLFAPRKSRSASGPMFTPLYLPWGVAFILGGALMMQFREPWKYHGAGILAIGLLYLLLGAFAGMRTARQSTH